MKIRKNEPMSKHTTWRIGGPVDVFLQPESVAELQQALQEAIQPCYVIGGGSNLLVADDGITGTVIQLGGSLCGLTIEDQTIIAEAGVPLPLLARKAAEHELSGLEFAAGIPGTVGGAVCMNAGAYDGEMKQVLESVTALFPEEGVRTLSLKELDLSYRHSLFTDRPDGVVLSAVFRLTAGDPETIRARMAELMQRRKASQPLEYPSAGSTFKRPVGHFAGGLIQQCGLKGLTVGGAQVSEKHAGFLINLGGATCADVLELIRQVQERVLAETGVRLEPEVRIIH